MEELTETQVSPTKDRLIPSKEYLEKLMKRRELADKRGGRNNNSHPLGKKLGERLQEWCWEHSNEISEARLIWDVIQGKLWFVVMKKDRCYSEDFARDLTQLEIDIEDSESFDGVDFSVMDFPNMPKDQFEQVTTGLNVDIKMSDTTDFRFRFDRSLQAAAYLLKLAGGEEYYLHILRMLYIADREYLLKYGQMITGDRVIATKNGLILSNTYDLIRGHSENSDKWACHIQTLPKRYKIRLIDDPGDGDLCRASEAVLDDVYAQYGKMHRSHLRDLIYLFPEWKKHFKKNTSQSIPWEDIFRLHNESMIKTARHNIELDKHQCALFSLIHPNEQG